MSGTLTVEQWVDALDYHYLSEFVRAGGSTVKFGVCYSDVRPHEAMDQLRLRAEIGGYIVTSLSSAEVKVHLVEQIFASISDAVPWDKVCDNILIGFAKQNHWIVPEDFTSEGVVPQLEKFNDLGEQQISLELQRRIAKDVLQDRTLAKDFRVAMSWLLRARLKGGEDDQNMARDIKDWLGGRVKLISTMRRYQIFTKIHRTNARYLLGSLLAFVRRAGWPGIVVILDGYRLLERQRAIDGSVNYSTGTLLDAYEVFRQFIDSTDEFDGLMFSVLVPEPFLDLGSRGGGRGLGRYPALESRVYDEVRDRYLANPLTALTRISQIGEIV